MKLLLVDGTNVVMRYASAMIPNLDECVPEEVVKVTRAVESAVRRCAQQIEATHVILALDSVENWRKARYPEYKATRTGTTGVWSNRLALHAASCGLAVQRASGFEADDIIATLVARSAKAGHSSAVLSSDSDLLALASLFCTVYQFGKKGEPRFAPRSMQWIAEHYQIASAGLLRDFKSLVGEPGDNLPGLPGVGPVKARAHLARWGSVEGLLRSGVLDVEQVQQLTLMRSLVTLREDVPLDPIVPSACRLTTYTMAGAA